MDEPDGALGDVTVVDASQGIAGPVATVTLADLGAEVISLEPPEGKTPRRYAEGAAVPNVARNKRSIALDLKAEGSTEVLHRLVEDADAFVHNNRPEAAERLGCDYETLSAIEPELVYCSVTGYGESGPYRDRASVDPLAQAMAGIMSITGEPDRKPARVGVSVSDVGTGIYAAFAIVTAIRHVERTGEGQKIEASLFDTAASFMGVWYTYFSMTGDWPRRQGHAWDAYAPAGVFETATGQLYLATPFQHLWERVCAAVDREDWLEDPRFETNEDRLAHQSELYDELDAEFSGYDREDLLDRLLAEGVPASEVNTVPEAAEDEHLRERGTVRYVEDAEGREHLAAASPLQLSATPASIRRGAPAVGEHTREILTEAGFDDADVDKLLADDVVRD